jgi:hypothetical protein
MNMDSGPSQYIHTGDGVEILIISMCILFLIVYS